MVTVFSLNLFTSTRYVLTPVTLYNGHIHQPSVPRRDGYLSLCSLPERWHSWTTKVTISLAVARTHFINSSVLFYRQLVYMGYCIFQRFNSGHYYQTLFQHLESVTLVTP